MRDGRYPDAQVLLDAADRLPEASPARYLIRHYRGHCLRKLQRFPQAIVPLFGPDSPELYVHEYGFNLRADTDEQATGTLIEAMRRVRVEEPENREEEPTLDLERLFWHGDFSPERRGVYDRIVEGLGLRPGQTVADVGAGVGGLAFAEARAVGRQGRILAVDDNLSCLAFIESYALATARDAVVKTLRATPSSSGLPQGSCDLITLHDRRRGSTVPFLRSLRLALGRGGRLAVLDQRPAEAVQAHLAKAGFGYARTLDPNDPEGGLVHEFISRP